MSPAIHRRFVILEHDWPFLHWDLMLEESGRLLTWRVLCEPELDLQLPITQSADHRIAYLDYVGQISDERGEVTRWDSGRLLHLDREGVKRFADVESDRFQSLIRIEISKEVAFMKKIA